MIFSLLGFSPIALTIISIEHFRYFVFLGGDYPISKELSKNQSLIGKVLSDFRDRAVKELIRKKGCHCPGLLVYNEKMGSWYLSFPFKAWGLAVLQLGQS